jgi:ribonuclease I
MNTLYLFIILLSWFLYYNIPPSIEVNILYYDLALKKCHSLDKNYTIHGVWPEYNNTEYPQFCNKSIKFNYTILNPILPELNKYWYSCPGKGSSNKSFWEHEYLKHGLCTPFIDEIDYFNWTLNLFKNATESGLIDQRCPLEGKNECMISYNLNWTLRN